MSKHPAYIFGNLLLPLLFDVQRGFVNLRFFIHTLSDRTALFHF
jgi:hypothetical protein